mmetsp:Transcript_4586/g.11392  ORF Transcript_4586/g.11392 Transcript_4586/m.11392 type:complete len:144 (+) Transcript_4586:426-857(+)
MLTTAPSLALIVHPLFRGTFPHRPSSPPTTAMSHRPESKWHELPSELLLAVGRTQASASSLVALSMVCRAYRSLGDNECLWRELCISKYGVSPTASPPSWKKLYRYNHELLYQHVLQNTVNVLRDFNLRQGQAMRLPNPIGVR